MPSVFGWEERRRLRLMWLQQEMSEQHKNKSPTPNTPLPRRLTRTEFPHITIPQNCLCRPQCVTVALCATMTLSCGKKNCFQFYNTFWFLVIKYPTLSLIQNNMSKNFQHDEILSININIIFHLIANKRKWLFYWKTEHVHLHFFILFFYFFNKSLSNFIQTKVKKVPRTVK